MGRNVPCIDPQHDNANASLRDTRVLHERSANTPRIEKRARRVPRDSNAVCTHFCYSCLRSVAVLVRLSPIRRRGEERALRWPTTHAKSALHGAHAACTVSQYSVERKLLGPRATAFKHGDHSLSEPVPATCRGVGAVEPWPMVWGGARHALIHNSLVFRIAWRVCHERSAYAPRDETRPGRAPRESNAVVTTFRNPCRRPVAVLVRSSLGRWRGEERAPRWSTTQPFQVRPVWNVRHGRAADTPRGEPRAGRAPLDSNATNFLFQSPCRRPVAVLVRSSLPRPTALSGAHPALAHNTATPSPHCAARAPWTVRNYPTGRKVRGPHATGLICDENKLLYPVPPTCRGKCD